MWASSIGTNMGNTIKRLQAMSGTFPEDADPTQQRNRAQVASGECLWILSSCIFMKFILFRWTCCDLDFLLS